MRSIDVFPKIFIKVFKEYGMARTCSTNGGKEYIEGFGETARKKEVTRKT